MRTGASILLLFLSLLLVAGDSRGQSYGLGFYSHEVVQDQRTGLDLSPEGTLCFEKDFELSFDLTLFRGRKDYFGYVLRLIDGSGENIDLIYDRNAAAGKHFSVVIGEHFSDILFDIPEKDLFEKWNKLRLSFDIGKMVLRLESRGRVYQTRLEMKKNPCMKILFGANEYLGFKTTDVPPMKLRNITVREGGNARYFWKLSEDAGNTAHEELSGNDGAALKPLWIKKLHYQWQPLLDSRVSGAATVAFDAQKELLYIVSDDSLIVCNIKGGRQRHIPYTTGKLRLLRGSQSVVDDAGNLLTFYIDRQLVSRFDTVTSGWTQNFPQANITDFWLYNKFYLPADSSLYTLGGYGHFVYKNQFHRYHFPTGSWQEVKVTGDTLTPRYLAALGQSGNGAYILGGYGSSSGQQMLNPRNLYDLLYFDAGARRLRKRYELDVAGEDFVFANSMVINEKARTYYALKFPKNKYRSNLQLMEGSLDRPEIKLCGSPVPYLFHDVRSYADLFFCRESNQFIAVTLYWEDNNLTTVKAYALSAPPIQTELKRVNGHNRSVLYWLSGAGVLGISALLVFSLWRRKGKKGDQQGVHTPAVPEEIKEEQIEEKPANKVFLFGDMQVFDREGTEITRQFTPLIRELFLIILIYSVRWERGISSEKLKELLWFDKSEESARNNRSVSIVKLRNILDKLDGCTISKETGYWKLDFDKDSTWVDYKAYVSLVREKSIPDLERIRGLAAIIRRGALLPNVNYGWMDVFKAEVSNEVIDICISFSASVDVEQAPDTLIELAGYIFCFDPVNEEAMRMKCRALAYLGKHTQAKNTYALFCREYRTLYDEDFGKSFAEVLGHG